MTEDKTEQEPVETDEQETDLDAFFVDVSELDIDPLLKEIEQ